MTFAVSSRAKVRRDPAWVCRGKHHPAWEIVEEAEGVVG